jgi:hypothetical protein
VRCAGCSRELEVGDQYIEGTAGEFLGQDVDEGVESLLASVLGSGRGDKIVYCEDCTQKGGDFLLNTVYGDEDEDAPSNQTPERRTDG